MANKPQAKEKTEAERQAKAEAEAKEAKEAQEAAKIEADKKAKEEAAKKGGAVNPLKTLIEGHAQPEATPGAAKRGVQAGTKRGPYKKKFSEHSEKEQKDLDLLLEDSGEQAA